MQTGFLQVTPTEGHTTAVEKYSFVFLILKLHIQRCFLLKYTSKLFHNFIRLALIMICSNTMFYLVIFDVFFLYFSPSQKWFLCKVAYASNDCSKAAMGIQSHVCWSSYESTASSPILTPVTDKDAIVWSSWFQQNQPRHFCFVLFPCLYEVSVCLRV